MSKREAELKSDFGKELARRLPGFVVLFYGTNGAPDRGIIGNGRQTNWEMKHATPCFDSPGRQELICMRLAAAGHCRYIIWWEDARGEGKRTMIVHPRVIHERCGWQLEPEAWTMGFDHRWLVEQVKKTHGL